MISQSNQAAKRSTKSKGVGCLPIKDALNIDLLLLLYLLVRYCGLTHNTLLTNTITIISQCSMV